MSPENTEVRVSRQDGPTQYVGILIRGSELELERIKKAILEKDEKTLKGVGVYIGCEIEMKFPCGYGMKFNSIFDIPLKDLRCPCGNDNHIFVKWTVLGKEVVPEPIEKPAEVVPPPAEEKPEESTRIPAFSPLMGVSKPEKRKRIRKPKVEKKEEEPERKPVQVVPPAPIVEEKKKRKPRAKANKEETEKSKEVEKKRKPRPRRRR